MSTPEGEVKKKVRQLLHASGCIPAGAKTSAYPDPVRGWYYMPSANGFGVHGIPDFVGHIDSRFFSIETKAPGNLDGLTANQEARRDEILLSGGAIFITDNPTTFAETWRRWTEQDHARIDPAQEAGAQPA